MIPKAGFATVLLFAAVATGCDDDASTTPTGTTVIIYQDTNFRGDSRAVAEQRPDLDDLPGCGGAGADWNDCISSIRIPNGWSITIYDEDNYTGNSMMLTAESRISTTSRARAATTGTTASRRFRFASRKRRTAAVGVAYGRALWRWPFGGMEHSPDSRCWLAAARPPAVEPPLSSSPDPSSRRASRRQSSPMRRRRKAKRPTTATACRVTAPTLTMASSGRR